MDLLLRVADAGDSHLAWRWLDRPDQPYTHRLAESVAAPALARLDAALADPLHGAFTTPSAEEELARALGTALLPDLLRRQLMARADAGIRWRITPSPRLARVPWELLAVDGGRRVLDIATVTYDPPSVTASHRHRLVQHFADVAGSPALRIIDPVTGSRLLRPVLSDSGIPHLESLLDADGFDYVRRKIDRRRLSALLTRQQWSRLLYFGHVSGSADEPGSAALHLSCTARYRGLAAPVTGIPGSLARPGHHRPLCALDLLLGTTTLDEPAASGLPTATTGPEIWPMPARVALIGCESGLDYASVEPFGLVMAILNAGAELVTATRWAVPTDTNFPGATPTSDLVSAVDAAHRDADPIGRLAAWQRAQLQRWRRNGATSSTPLIWASLTQTLT